MNNKKILQKQDEEILKRVCSENGVEIDLVKDLIKTEKESQLGSRHGVYKELKNKIKNSIEK